ncbi:tail fiber protein [Klebsiella phage P-K7R]|nr:tail fiber protein [Klebsiella phage P-K7R]
MAKNVITGSKGGSSKPSKPKEMQDNLISINKIKVLLAVSDGECDPDFSLKNLLLDDVVVQNEDGTFNYEGVTAEFRPGTQDQPYIQGFTDTSSEITVARDLTTKTPYSISVTNKNLSAIRIRVLMPRGVTSEDDGDLVGVRVEYAVDMAVDGGSFNQVMSDVIEGKTTSGYDRSRRIDLPSFNSQVILRVRRVTPDSTSAKVADAIKLQSYAEVIDAKFRYPLTGLVYVEFDSELFPNQIPNISTKKRWKLINIPSNYDPIARTYSGNWNGTFKKAWSNNPAWVLYDLITNQRYGLDQRELGIPLDKWALYDAGRYCDQMVPDGKGGTEPRYLCDVVIQSQVEAYQLVTDICSIFRGMTFWNGESLSIVVDKPREPSYIFTNDNVVNGEFSYTFASEKSMYTSCNVTFDDEQNLYQQDVEPVFDTEAALRFGHNPTSITAIGCTRRSEANRRGRWILKTNLRSTTVNFATGLEGMIPTIGDVVAISDNFWSSNLALNLSGRVMEVSGLQVFLPFKVDARAGDFIMINKPDGKPVKRTISRVSADGKTIELNVGFGFDVKPDAVFAIERTDIALQQYVVTQITKGDGDEEFTYSITAVQYDPNKYDAIDYGVNVDDRPTSIVDPDRLAAPKNVKLSSYSRVLQGVSVETMHVSWDKVPYASAYEMQWRKGNGNWHNTPQTANKEIEVEGIYAGNYAVRVRSVSASGSSSGWSNIVTASLTGKVGEPGAPINLTASTDEVFGIRVKWGMPAGTEDTAYIELQQSETGSEEAATLLTLVPYPQSEYWHSILPAGYVNHYRIRSVDRIGNVSAWTNFVRGQSSIDLDEITGAILDDILESEGLKDLIEGSIEQSDKIQDAVNTAKDAANKIKNQAQAVIENALATDVNLRWNRVQNGKRKAEIGQTVEMVADETQARIDAIAKLRTEFDKGITAEITKVIQLISDESQTRATQVQELRTEFTTEIGKTNASVQRAEEAITNESEARAQAITNLDAKLTKVINDAKVELNANIQRVDQAVTDEAGARAQAIESLKAEFKKTIDGAKKELTASIDRVDQAVTDESEARAQAVQSLDAKLTKLVGDTKTEINASINRVDQAVANEAEARANADTALSTQIGETKAALTQKLDSWVTAENAGVMYGVNLGLKYKGKEYKAGMNLMLVGEGDNAKSQFLFSADRFAIIPSLERGDLKTLPFVVENNQVFMQSALIKDGTITNAKIGDFIKSNNWDGNNGWYIGKDGWSSFLNVTVRGTIYGNDGYFNGTVYASRIEGDVMIAESDTIPFRNYDSVPGGDYEIFRINGEDFDRQIDTNLIVWCSCSQRNYFRLIVQTPGKGDVEYYYLDTGNEGGGRAFALRGFYIPAAGRGQQNRIIVRVQESRSSTIKTYTPWVEREMGQKYNDVTNSSINNRNFIREKSYIAAYRAGRRIIA